MSFALLAVPTLQVFLSLLAPVDFPHLSFLFRSNGPLIARSDCKRRRRWREKEGEDP